MMHTKDSAAMTDFIAGTDTEKARHTQWRKLSRKRRRTLIRRTLRRLESEAKRKSVFVGMEDYSHVQSLVYSELPYNPNGHHCSCNCLDEVAYNPELELYGWSYGKELKSPGQDHRSSPGSDGALLRDNTAESAAMTSSTNEDGSYKAEGKDSLAMGIDQEDSISVRKEPSRTSEVREPLRRESIQTKQGCFCDRVVSRGNTRRSSTTKHLFQMGTPSRPVCRNCQKLLSAMNRFNSLSTNRRVSVAKEDGTLRSRIYALRKKLRRYSEVIQRNDYLAIQEKVKRRLTIGDKLQKKALGLSDRMKMMKFRESYYWVENKGLKERLRGGKDYIANGGYIQQGLEEGSYEMRGNRAVGDEEWEEQDGIAELPSDGVSYGSPRKHGGRTKKRIELPAVIEEEEEMPREAHTSDGRIEHYHGPKEDNNKLKAAKNDYDILFINHSDNEAENKGTEDDDEDSDNAEDDDDFARSWPAYKNDSFKSSSWKYNPAANRKRDNVVKGDYLKLDPVTKLVYRLDSGLSFGPADPETLQDESLANSVNRVEEEKNLSSNLPDDNDDIPLVERQRSFGNIIRGVIREEIYKDRGGSKDEGEMLESQDELGDSEEEANRKRKILEDNLIEFVEEAQKKNEIVEEIFKDRDSGTPGVRTSSGESSKDKEDNDDYEDGEKIELESKAIKKAKLVDLRTLRTLAQKHQTLKSLRNIDEDMYQVSEGVDKMNKVRMMEAKARTTKDKDREGDEVLPLSQREQDYSIPDPMNKRSTIEERITDNSKTMAQLDYNYDLLRDLRFLILNQNTSRAVSYSYFNPAPPYLRTKWQKRIKRGFLRGVKEQKVNEVQLERVEDVTLKLMDRDEIHRVTLKGKGKLERSMSTCSNPPSRLSTARRSVSTARLDRESTVVTLPPLKLPNSRASSPADSVFDDETGGRSRTMSFINENDDTLQQAFKKLGMRHKYIEKEIMMKNVIRLTSNVKNNNAFSRLSLAMDSPIQETDRTMSESEAAGLFTSRLKSNRRRSVAAVQNIAVRDQLSGRMSVNSNEKRRFSLMNPIKEY